MKKLSEQKWNDFVEVSLLRKAATTWIKNANYFNIYTGETMEGNIALYEDRIAYVGSKEPKADDHTIVINAADYTLVPGYIEPHSHPFQIYNPLTWIDYSLTCGTTTMMHDSLLFFLNAPQEKMEKFFQDLQASPVKNFWWARLDSQTPSPELEAKVPLQRTLQTLQHPQVIQAGELTAFKRMLDGEPLLRERMYWAYDSGKRIEAHNPGSSVETLNAMMAAGATCCHESITTDEVMRRLRLGLYASLRNSSIRPDLPELLQGLLKLERVPWDRLMMTTDGSPPFFYEQGTVDHLIKIALDCGVPAWEAYRMVTLNPAVYYGLDRDLGGIAPGRVADILFLKDLHHPTPVQVMANGKLVEKGESAVQVDWSSYGIEGVPAADWKAEADWFRVEARGDFPVGEMMNAVIIRQRDETLPEKDGSIDLTDKPDYLYVALVDRAGKWITTGIVKGFGDVEALASTYTVSQDLFVLGRDPQEMAAAVNRVMEMGGGICLREKNESLFKLGLPLLGGMSEKGMAELIDETGQFLRLLQERGYQHEDPIYSLFFFSAIHLPVIRFTRDGIYSTKQNKILVPSRPLR